MAAHSLRILMEMYGEKSLTDDVRNKYRSALAGAGGLDLPCIEPKHWCILNDIIEDETSNIFDLRDGLIDIVAETSARWLAYGRPKDVEEWKENWLEKWNAGMHWNYITLQLEAIPDDFIL